MYIFLEFNKKNTNHKYWILEHNFIVRRELSTDNKVVYKQHLHEMKSRFQFPRKVFLPTDRHCHVRKADLSKLICHQLP